jgi:hypothetical protein
MRQKPGCRCMMDVSVFGRHAGRRARAQEERVGRGGGVDGRRSTRAVVGVGDLALAGQRVEAGGLMLTVVHGQGWEEMTVGKRRDMADHI